MAAHRICEGKILVEVFELFDSLREFHLTEVSQRENVTKWFDSNSLETSNSPQRAKNSSPLKAPDCKHTMFPGIAPNNLLLSETSYKPLKDFE